MRCRPPGPASRAARLRQAKTFAPMGPVAAAEGEPSPTLVMSEARGANVVDLDGNVYVDLAAGFGALLLGHSHPEVVASYLGTGTATLARSDHGVEARA